MKSKLIGPGVKADEQYGLVYQLTKPEFKIIRTPPTATDPAKYTLAVAYVPDPEHRYGLVIKPGDWSKVDTSVTLSSTGAITGLTADSQEQVTPTIKAIGDFTVSLLQAVTSGVASGLMPFTAEADRTKSFDDQVKELKARVDGLGLPADNADKARIKAAIDAQAAVSNSDAGRFAVLLAKALPDLKDREFLAAAASPQNPNGTDVATARKAYQSALEAELKDSNGATVTSGPLFDEWSLVKWDVARAVTTNDHLQLTRLAGREKADPFPTHAKPVENEIGHLAGLANSLAGKARIFVEKRMGLSPLVGSLAIRPTPARLKRERVDDLLLEITKQEVKFSSVADDPARTAVRGEIGKSWVKVFDLLDADVEYEAMQKIEAILKAGPRQLADAGKRSQADEYSKARAEWVALIAQYTAKLERLKVDAADPQPPKKDIWGEENADVAMIWNVQEEARRAGVAAAVGTNGEPAAKAKAAETAANAAPAKPLPRLLQFTSTPQYQHDPVATRVREMRGDDISTWPKFVVRINKAQREHP